MQDLNQAPESHSAGTDKTTGLAHDRGPRGGWWCQPKPIGSARRPPSFILNRYHSFRGLGHLGPAPPPTQRRLENKGEDDEEKSGEEHKRTATAGKHARNAS
jgi:hypothetical protein